MIRDTTADLKRFAPSLETRRDAIVAGTSREDAAGRLTRMRRRGDDDGATVVATGMEVDGAREVCQAQSAPRRETICKIFRRFNSPRGELVEFRIACFRTLVLDRRSA
jgi:hypothetical protein